MPNVFDDATTRDIIAIVRQWRAGKLPIPGAPSRSQLAPYQPQLPFFTNDSGETIPPYACMQITGTLDIGDRNYLVADKPADTDGTAGAFIFNGAREVEADTEGLAQASSVLRGFKDTGTATGGERWNPVSGQWYIEQDDAGQFICCGDDDVDDNVVKVVSVAKSSSGAITRLGFWGVNAANAYSWGTQNTSSAYASFSHYSGTGVDANLLSPGMGITVTSQGGSAPSNAEVLSFSQAGRYKIHLEWIVSCNGSAIPVGTSSAIYLGAGTGGAALRKIRESSAVGLFGYYSWITDARVIELSGSDTVWISIGAGTTSPDNVGMVTIEKV